MIHPLSDSNILKNLMEKMILVRILLHRQLAISFCLSLIAGIENWNKFLTLFLTHASMIDTLLMFFENKSATSTFSFMKHIYRNFEQSYSLHHSEVEKVDAVFDKLCREFDGTRHYVLVFYDFSGNIELTQSNFVAVTLQFAYCCRYTSRMKYESHTRSEERDRFLSKK